MENKICLIYNYAQHYRTNIFKLLDKNLTIDFVFGDKYRDVKKMDYSILLNNVLEVENVYLPLKPFYYQKQILKKLKEDYNIYLVLGDVTCLSTWIFLILSKFTNKRIYLWTHGWYGKESNLKKIIKKAFFNLPKGIFLYGNYAKELMLSEGFKEEKLHVIYNSLNYDEQKKYRGISLTSNIYSEYFKNDNRNLIFIGRLTPIKKLELVLYALEEMKKENVFFNLTFIGEGNKKNELQSLTKLLDLENNVWFYGETYSEKEISKLIYNADLCVSPGNVGLTAMHAMAYGTPVITHNRFEFQMPEFEAIVNGETGTFFNYGDYISLAKNILRWFKDNHDRNSVREECYKIIDNYYNPYTQLEIFRNFLK